MTAETRWTRYVAAITATVAMTAALMTSPALADDSLGWLLDDANTPADTPSEPPVITEPVPDPIDAEPEPDPIDPERVQPDQIEDLAATIEEGPVGVVDTARYESVWIPGELTPAAVKIVDAGTDAHMQAIELPDLEALMALVKITSADAPTVFRFTDAVPEGHTAYVHADGSVRFVDAAGVETDAGIAAPWALDATGTAVTTTFALDGTTLTQTVDHTGATYPVVADPLWFAVAVYVTYVALRAAPVVASTYATCQRVQCGPIIGRVIRNMRIGDRSPSSQRPSGRCRIPSRC